MVADGRIADAKAVLKLFGQFEDHGTLPNMIRGSDAGNRDTSDAPLWFAAACADLVRYEGDERFLDEPCGSRSIRSILVSIGKSYMAGTANGIRTDPESGLVFSPMHFTWMDTNFPAGTPRQGYPIEIQALWFATLKFLSRIDTETDWEKTASQVREAVPVLFYLKEEGYLSDCLHAETGQAAEQAMPDDALRPNQLFALTLGAVSDPEACRRILEACETLIVPGAIRSLADRPVRRPLPVWHQGRLLNDPQNPYQGHYAGDEDTRRKPTYHNGTAWTWVFPSFCEAWVAVYGEPAKPTARTWLGSYARLVQEGCIGHVPEILDGDFPHRQRGCDAQAWGASEALRVWHLLGA
jgi:predicted glycogen debranching enzyme